MALSNSIHWDVRTGGSDLNGGGFNQTASGVDYSQQNTAQKSGADLAMHASTNTKCKPNSAGVSANDVGNLVKIASGTSWTAGVYEIVSQDGTYWTLDRSPSAAGNANLATYKMGGALASPGACSGLVVGSASAANVIWIKSGTYTISSATANVSGGLVSIASAPCVKIEGYGTTHGDKAARPLLQMQASLTNSYVAIVNFDDYNKNSVVNIAVDGNATGNNYVYGIVAGAYSSISFCKASNCKVYGLYGGNIHYCEVTTSSGLSAMYGDSIIGGVAYGCWCTGIRVSICGTVADCVSFGNTGTGFTGAATFINCSAYNNGGNGFDADAAGDSYNLHLINCIAYSNAGYGVKNGLVLTNNSAVNCAFGANTSGITQAGTFETNLNQVTLSADPFTNSAGSDFTLNTTAGGGAACRAAGYGTLPAFIGTGYPDIGAIQHQDAGMSSGGLLTHPGLSGGMRG